MSSTLEKVQATLDGRKHQALEKLKEFLSMPSVSAKPDHADHVRDCARWLADQLKFAMLDVSLMETHNGKGKAGHPVVIAKNKHIAGRPTVLLYGHYDVQPPEPLDLWKTPPFEATVRKDETGHDAIYARGAVDDKGQVWAHVEAITAWQAHGGVPLNLIVLIEGEEEVGSEGLETFIKEHADQLRADICLISDTGIPDRSTPAITYGLRGLVYAQINLKGPSHDLHSGQFGGATPNPANILCQIISSFHDSQGRVTIPGFYDDVQIVPMEERKILRSKEFDDDAFLGGIKVPFSSGEAGFNIAERICIRPTLDVNGLTSGYQGVGAKTVLPSVASAKVSMRLVPNQNPYEIRDAFERAVKARVPNNVTCEIEFFSESWPAVTPIDSKASKLAAEAVEIAWGKKPAFIRGGGSIPVVADIKRLLNCDTLLVGFGLPDDRVHSPNEKMDLECFYKGIATCAALYEKLAQLK
ncbi:MAG TPA: dipeptidase [Tepidisphaeraceae bacterium]|nr:dipeptidase [Tepidisphaeraceae bacterium]